CEVPRLLTAKIIGLANAVLVQVKSERSQCQAGSRHVASIAQNVGIPPRTGRGRWVQVISEGGTLKDNGCNPLPREFSEQLADDDLVTHFPHGLCKGLVAQ